MRLFVNVSAPVRVLKVPVVGNVTFVVFVVVKVVANAPVVVKLPPSVIVLEPLFTPVPPFVPTKVPATVTAPVVAVDGVNPVVPALKEVTTVFDAIFTKSTPFHAATQDSPATIVMPAVGPTPTSLID
jgi:hypothetical protein